MQVIDYVKGYLNFNWSLVPIIPETKIPPIKWTEFQNRRPTLSEVEEWLKNNWYMAVVTGDISGVCVVDDDRIKHKLSEWGFESPVISQSKSGGKHYYFRYDREIHSHSNTKLFIDLKAWHSYCLLPPFDGRIWLSKPSENLSKLLPIPDEIVRLINSDKKEIPQGLAQSLTGSLQNEPLRMEDFINIPEGARTDSLHRIACSIFKKMDREDGIRVLIGVNQTYAPPLDKDEFDYQVTRAFNFTKNTSGKIEKPPAIPLSIKEVDKMRGEDKALEKLCPKTGYPELDVLVKGFLPKHFWTITGETNVGKTCFACNLAENVRKQKRKVLYVALEPEYKVVDYLASVREDKTFEELSEFDRVFDDGCIKILTLSEVPTYKDLIKSLKANSDKFEVIVIDHIGYFCRANDDQTFVVEQAQTIRDMVQLSKELKTCILAIAHPRKPSAKQKSRILSLYDVSGTAAFAQDSTEGIVLYRPPADPDNPLFTTLSNTGNLLVLKSKAGKNGSCTLYFNDDKAKITTPETLKFDFGLPKEKTAEAIKKEEDAQTEEELIQARSQSKLEWTN